MDKIIMALSRKKGYEKILTAMTLICSLCIFILAIMQLTGVRNNITNMIVSLTGAVMLIQALQNWRKNRKVAVFSLCAALFAFCCAIVIFALS